MTPETRSVRRDGRPARLGRQRWPVDRRASYHRRRAARPRVHGGIRAGRRSGADRCAARHGRGARAPVARRAAARAARARGRDPGGRHGGDPADRGRRAAAPACGRGARGRRKRDGRPAGRRGLLWGDHGRAQAARHRRRHRARARRHRPRGLRDPLAARRPAARRGARRRRTAGRRARAPPLQRLPPRAAAVHGRPRGAAPSSTRACTNRSARARAAAEQAAQTVHALQRVTDAALAYLSIDDLLSELLVRIRDILHADTAAILLLEDEARMLRARAAKGIEEEVEQGVRIPLGAASRAASPPSGGRSRSSTSPRTRSSTRSCARRASARCSASRCWSKAACSACCTSARSPRGLHRRRRQPPAARRRPRGAGDRARAALRAPARRRGPPAQPAARRPPGAPRPRDRRALPARRDGVEPGRRLV